MKPQIIKLQSYTSKLPKTNCTIKVAVKVTDFHKNDCLKTQVFTDAIYEDGFVSIDGGKDFHLAHQFLFHKLKRTK
ncbi:hypothetical protein WAF17_16215 [Bernardetia sp. ABR2-2B]|uniref:hypothetical protein n=1 Tax=Bernardetia sp. ABR2-2B TaxID=3127472 RepID=UPI0030D12CD6